MALGQQQIDRFSGAFGIVDADIGDAAIEDGFEDADARRQLRRHSLVAKGQNAGEKDQARRLVGTKELQIFEAALGIVLRMADQDTVAMGAGLVF